MILVGTKMDLRTDATTLADLKATGATPYTAEQGIALAKEIGAASYVECSAKVRVGLDEVFDRAVMTVFEYRERMAKRKRRCAIL